MLLTTNFVVLFIGLVASGCLLVNVCYYGRKNSLRERGVIFLLRSGLDYVADYMYEPTWLFLFYF